MKQNNLRIISLIPSATEIVYLLGLQNNLVARSDECNFPSQVLKKEVISASIIDNNLTSLEIDKAVKKSLHKGRGLYHLDRAKLSALKPNLILTQELCKVCAIPFTHVKKAARFLKGDVTILSLEPQSIEDMFKNILTVGRLTKTLFKAQTVVSQLKKKLKTIQLKAHSLKKPTVVIIEWLDPVMIAGHWVPQMVGYAGGKMLFSKPFTKSRYVNWREILEVNPDILIFAPCGFNIKRTKKEVGIFELKKGWQNLSAVKNKKVFIVDGDSYITRSGPRLIEGVKILAKIFHPEVNFSSL